ncbi:MAG: HlyD family efflux transporter periplasmic adaptor subunit [Fuerstiella sp.]|nr:HlyD family efflux transporter periplasmic adaptor subunit [Fuerstiella sp.]
MNYRFFGAALRLVVVRLALRSSRFMSHVKETTDANPDVKAIPEALPEAGISPQRLWQQFLQSGLETLSADAGVLWVIPADSDKLVPQGMCGNRELRQAIVQRDTHQVGHVLQAAATDEVVLHRTDASESDPWAERCILALPVHHQGALYGLLEYIQPAGEPDSVLNERRPKLESRLRQLERTARESSERKTSVDDPFWLEFEEFSYNIHRSLVTSEVADVAANDARQLLRCDRLSIAVLRGRKTTIAAVAGQDLVNRRSEQVRSLLQIAKECVSVGEIIEFRADRSAVAPHLLETLSHHVELSAAKLILAIPLYAPAVRRPGEDNDPHSEPIRRIVGCLLVEQFRQSRLEHDREHRIQVVADAAGAALANSLSQQEILFLPARRLLGKGLNYFRGRTLAKTLLVLGLIVAVTLALVIVPWEYRVEAQGRIMPETQRHIFAPWDGVVLSISVANGQRVSQGDEVLRIRNDELHAELVAAEDDLNEKQQQVLTLRAKITNAGRVLTNEDTVQLKGELAEIRLQINGLKKQITILRQREKSLHVTAPIDGVVATFQLEEKLRDRPVARGEHLLEIMDDSKDWILELRMPEHRMGHLLRAAKSSEGNPLDVEYVLATDATGTFNGRLNRTDVASRSEVKQDSEVVVQMRADIDKNELPFQRIGGEATAKVNCGKQSLGYVLFGDVWEFILRFVWI